MTHRVLHFGEEVVPLVYTDDSAEAAGDMVQQPLDNRQRNAD